MAVAVVQDANFVRVRALSLDYPSSNSSSATYWLFHHKHYLTILCKCFLICKVGGGRSIVVFILQDCCEKSNNHLEQYLAQNKHPVSVKCDYSDFCDVVALHSSYLYLVLTDSVHSFQLFLLSILIILILIFFL